MIAMFSILRIVAILAVVALVAGAVLLLVVVRRPGYSDNVFVVGEKLVKKISPEN